MKLKVTDLVPDGIERHIAPTWILDLHSTLFLPGILLTSCFESFCLVRKPSDINIAFGRSITAQDVGDAVLCRKRPCESSASLFVLAGQRDRSHMLIDTLKPLWVIDDR